MARPPSNAPAPLLRLGVLGPGLLILALALAFVPSLELPGKLPRLVILRCVAWALLSVGLWYGRGRAAPAFWILSGVWGLAGVLGLLQVPGADFWSASRDALTWVSLWCLAASTAWLATRQASPGVDDGLEWAANATLVVLGLLGLAQAWWGLDWLAQTRPPAATFVNRNVAAQAMIGLVPLAAPALLDRRAVLRWVAGGGVGLGLAVLIATRARGAWLAAGVGWGLALLLVVLWGRTRWERGSAQRSRPRPGFGPAVLAGALGLAALVLPVENTGRALPSVATTLGSLRNVGQGSGITRVILWRNTWELVEEAPWFGHGPGRFVTQYPRFQAATRPTPQFGTEYQPEHAHHDWLEVAAEIGIPGALALGLLFLGAFWRSARAGVRGAPADVREFGRLAAMGALGLDACWSFPLHSPTTAALAFVLVGRGWSTDTGGAPAASLARRISAVACGGVVVLVGWLGVAEYRAQASLGDAIRARGEGRCPTAAASADEVIARAPWLRRERRIAAMIQFDCDADAARALSRIEAALAVNPDDINLLLAAGARRLKAGRPADAASAFRHGTRITPELARAWLGLAMAAHAQGRLGEAQEACRQAAALDGEFQATQVFCRGNRLL